MTDTDVNLADLNADVLAAELARREQEAAREQAQAEAAWQVERANRARDILDNWKSTEEELIASEADAYEEFKAALLADPVVVAFVRYRRHRFRRASLRTEAQTAANMLGEPQTAERIPYLNDWGSRLIEDLTDVADAEARRLAAEDSEAVMRTLTEPGSEG